jgi:hypothetical protein
MLSKVKSERSEAFKAEDRDRIFDAVRRMLPGGFTQLDSMVLQVLERWMVDTLRGLAAAGWLYLFMLLCVVIDARFTVSGYGGPASMAWDSSRTAVSLLHFSITDWPAGVLFVPLVLWALHVWTPGSLRELRRSEVDAAPVPTLHVHAKKP